MDNIADILSNLSAQDIENLKETAAALFSQGKQEENKSADLFGSLGADAQMISKISGIMQAMNHEDSRCDLIRALKPLLKPERQHRADEAIRLLKIISMLPLLREQNLF